MNELKHWLCVAPFPIDNFSDTQKIAFSFVLNSISFSYWGEPNWRVKYKNRYYNGAKALMTSLAGAISKEMPVLDPAFLSTIRPKQLAKILDGENKIPLLIKRTQALRELGKVITVKYDGDFRNFYTTKGALSLVDQIISDLPSFQDSVLFRERRIYFNKRAQLLVADLKNFAGLEIDNIEALTACADYKLPQVLRSYGILEYSHALRDKISGGQKIRSGSKEEVAIRVATILAVHQIAELIRLKKPHITDNQINDFLWLKAQRRLKNSERYHLTRTTKY